MKTHGNSLENNAPHHIYAIDDHSYEDLYKFGLCGDPLNSDGSSPRGNRQANELNRAVRWRRFFSRVVLTNIPGRAAALSIENEYIEAYTKAHGHPPPGNVTE